MTERSVTPLLRTDGYKFSMAQSGFPLRRETFYMSFRRGGWQLVPFDLEREVRALLEVQVDDEQRAYLAASGYAMSGGMEAAIGAPDPAAAVGREGLQVRAVPAGTWVHEREPIVSVTHTSFAASWLEPLLLRLNFPIQLATQIARHGAALDPLMLHASCEAQAEIMRRVIRAVGRDREALERLIVVDEDGYREAVRQEVESLVDATGDPTRIFEVGMRAATCEQQHRVCLETLRGAGVTATSNVDLARALEMKAVGTMGHEHVQRWGDDRAAFRAMRDMRPGTPSYLLDTFDTLSSGIPAALEVVRERPHPCAIRYDSGDKFAQYLFAHGEFERAGITPVHILEDGLDVAMTRRFEQLRSFTGLAPDRQIYGYGGSLVSRCWRNPLTRDAVAAVYKLSSTSGEPRMKFGNEAGLGKVSVPGDPVVWRRLRGRGPLSVIGQAGERVPEDYVCLSGNPDALEALRICNVDAEIARGGEVPYELSVQTQALVSRLSRSHHHARPQT